MSRKMNVLFGLLLISAMAFGGCGQAKTDSASSGTSAASSAASASSADTSAAAASSAASAAGTSGTAGTASAGDSAITSDIVTESNKGEGVNVAPGTPVGLASGAIEGTPGNAYPVPAAQESFRLTVNKIELTDERNANAAAADRVVRISYTYENTSSDSMLLIGQTSFKLLDADGKACEIYYFDPTSDSEASADPAEKGASHTAAIGFILSGSQTDVTLVYDDQQTQSGTEYYWKAKV